METQTVISAGVKIWNPYHAHFHGKFQQNPFLPGSFKRIFWAFEIHPALQVPFCHVNLRILKLRRVEPPNQKVLVDAFASNYNSN